MVGGDESLTIDRHMRREWNFRYPILLLNYAILIIPRIYTETAQITNDKSLGDRLELIRSNDKSLI